MAHGSSLMGSPARARVGWGEGREPWAMSREPLTSNDRFMDSLIDELFSVDLINRWWVASRGLYVLGGKQELRHSVLPRE